MRAAAVGIEPDIITFKEWGPTIERYRYQNSMITLTGEASLI